MARDVKKVWCFDDREREGPACDSVERPRLANLSAVSPFVRLAVIMPKSDRLRRARCPAPLSPARGTQNSWRSIRCRLPSRRRLLSCCHLGEPTRKSGCRVNGPQDGGLAVPCQSVLTSRSFIISVASLAALLLKVRQVGWLVRAHRQSFGPQKAGTARVFGYSRLRRWVGNGRRSDFAGFPCCPVVCRESNRSLPLPRLALTARPFVAAQA